MPKPRPPKFVKMVETDVRFVYRPSMDEYYCHGGNYYIGYKYTEDGLVVNGYVTSGVRKMHNRKLVEITKEEYLEYNKGLIDSYETS